MHRAEIQSVIEDLVKRRRYKYTYLHSWPQIKILPLPLPLQLFQNIFELLSPRSITSVAVAQVQGFHSHACFLAQTSASGRCFKDCLTTNRRNPREKTSERDADDDDSVVTWLAQPQAFSLWDLPSLVAERLPFWTMSTAQCVHLSCRAMSP